MSKEKIVPMSDVIKSPQGDKTEIQQSSITDFISSTSGLTEINQMIISAIQKGRKKAQQSKK